MQDFALSTLRLSGLVVWQSFVGKTFLPLCHMEGPRASEVCLEHREVVITAWSC